MKKLLLSTTTALAFAASAAMSQSVTDQIVAALLAQDYDKIEVTTGLTQIKVEATRGELTLEAIYDVSGLLLYQDVSEADDDDLDETGVFFEQDDEDFFDADDQDDDEDGEDGEEDDGDDDLDEDDDDNNDDNDEDEDEGEDEGEDDDSDD